MELDKGLVSGSMALLVLKLLEDGDQYGYEMIESLRLRSDDTFHLKAGTIVSPAPRPGRAGTGDRLRRGGGSREAPAVLSSDGSGPGSPA